MKTPNISRHPAISAFIISLMLLFSIRAGAFTIHCDKDSRRIQSLLDSLSHTELSPGERIAAVAESFYGTPYMAATLESDKEDVKINVCQFDCVTLTETSLALAITSMKKAPLWTDLASTIESIRYRGGKADGYASRLHYFSDWISDNIYRGNISEITQSLDNANFLAKSLNYITKHPDHYPALSDSLNMAAMKKMEAGFCNYKIPYLKKEMFQKKKTLQQLADGDIIAFVSREPGLDISHTGILKIIDGEPYLIHASVSAGKVVIEKNPLQKLLKHEFRNATGIRILRLTDD